MARTPLFGALTRALIETGAPFRPRALSRRRFLALSAAAAAAAACTGSRHRGSIGIVGAGVAGLTAAYRLAQEGLSVSLYEASARLGGRMFTRRAFNADGQFCELGGELVDTNHEALRTLAQALGVNVVPLSAHGAGEDVYYIGRQLHRQSEMASVYAPLAARITADQAALFDAEEDWTERARALDQTSLSAYLAGLGNYAPRWAMEALDVAYLGEYGIPTEEQSALNLVDFIGTDLAQGFQMFGESDEALRIEGGSSALIEALAGRLSGVRQVLQRPLTAIAKSETGVQLTFETPTGRVEYAHDQVILALPFTKLRAVDGLDALGLGDAQLRAVRELGYGDNAKLMVSTRSRPWLEAPLGLTGALYTDRFQSVWETSRGQAGEAGVLTNFVSGQHDRNAALRDLRRGFGAISRATGESLDESATAWMDWSRQPFALGSYAGAKVGQYTTLLEHAATASPDGRIHFAGEHTSVDFLGFMNGAVESGLRAADETLTAG